MSDMRGETARVAVREREAIEYKVERRDNGQRLDNTSTQFVKGVAEIGQDVAGQE